MACGWCSNKWLQTFPFPPPGQTSHYLCVCVLINTDNLLIDWLIHWLIIGDIVKMITFHLTLVHWHCDIFYCLTLNNCVCLMWCNTQHIHVTHMVSQKSSRCVWCRCPTLSTEPLQSPRPASPVRSSRMSMCPSLLRSSWSNSSAQRFSLSWSGPGDSLSWQCAQENRVCLDPITASHSQLMGCKGIS